MKIDKIIYALKNKNTLTTFEIAKLIYGKKYNSQKLDYTTHTLKRYANKYVRQNTCGQWTLINESMLDLFYPEPCTNLEKAKTIFTRSIFNVINQLHRSSKIIFTLNEINVLASIWKQNKGYKETAKSMQLTSERVRQIHVELIKKVIIGFDDLFEAENKLESLKEEIKTLQNENYRLNQELNKLGFTSNVTRVEKSSSLNLLINQSIEFLDLSVRAFNCLKKADIITVGHLLNYTEKDLFSIKNMGKNSVREIIVELKARGLTLKSYK